MEVVVKQDQQNMKAKLYDLLVAISWADLSRTYFRQVILMALS